MSKWKCEICNSSFENFDARGFDNQIYCPLCYYKKLYKDTELERERLNNIINELEHDFESYELEYLQDTYQGSLADFIETELERIQELKGSDKE